MPLSLKAIGVYHSVLHQSSGGYLALYEEPAWYVFWRDTSATYTLSPSSGAGQSAFCFSSVYAPTDLNTVIYHRWEEYNPQTKNWETQALISYPISGGRADGYHGYTVKTVSPGEWRCDVETASGALIGQIDFNVAESPVPPALSQTVL